jgi:hypothetical protein
MEYEVYTSDALAYHLENDILYGDHDEYFAEKLASKEVHVIDYYSHIMGKLGLAHKVVIDLSWVKDLENPNTEKRIKKLIGYLERYSNNFSEAIRVSSKMEVCGIQPNACFFSSYKEMAEFLGGKMQIC